MSCYRLRESGHLQQIAKNLTVQMHIVLRIPRITSTEFIRGTLGTDRHIRSRQRWTTINAKHVVGIDLGTSNSAVAAIVDGKAQITGGDDGLVTCSCVAILEVSCSSPK